MIRGLWNVCVSRIGLVEAGFVLVVVLVAFAAILSCVTQQYWMTRAVSHWFEVHAFNGSTKLYFEALSWTLLLTILQFYKYHISTLAIYDAIVIKEAGRRHRWTHHVLQAVLSMFTWICVLVIAVTVFSALHVLEIMNLYEINLEEIMSIYIPWLNLDYIVLYFVLIDLTILLMNFNFSSCEACAPERRQEFVWEREGLCWAVFIGGLLGIMQWAIISISAASRSPFEGANNITVEFARTAPLLFTIVLQLFHVVTSVRVQAKSMKRRGDNEDAREQEAREARGQV